MQPKRRQNIQPPTVPGVVGDHHVDADHRRWRMTAHGWELLDLLKVMVVNADKGHWINAARQSGCGLEQWVNKTLNEAAAKYPLKR
jgi:hypothetical protein